MTKQQNSSIFKHVKKTLIGGISGAVSAVSLNSVSTIIINKLGFTASGVGAGTVAAGIQASIGNVVAGSTFATLQSVGALGVGLFGSYLLPVIIIASLAGAGIGYKMSKNKQAQQQKRLQKQAQQKKRQAQQRKKRQQQLQRQKRQSKKQSLASMLSIFNNHLQPLKNKYSDVKQNYDQRQINKITNSLQTNNNIKMTVNNLFGYLTRSKTLDLSNSKTLDLSNNKSLYKKQ